MRGEELSLMGFPMHTYFRRCLVLAFLAAASVSSLAPAADDALTLVVMDPLAAPLSCPCVKGYAQRDYDKLAEHLASKLGRSVNVAYCDSLVAALKDKTEGKADIIIGKHSVVLFDAKKAGREVKHVAMLTSKEGDVTQHGLIVVPAKDPAKSVADLKGYQIIFGPEESDEKHAAALALLKEHGVPAPDKIETRSACDEGATLILEAGPEHRGAAVISSYAKPLLEGCGTVKKGDLRVIGETAPVPFVAAFVSDSLEGELKASIQKELLGVFSKPLLCVALETKYGFVQPAKKK
jgi:ABC-type phosphate/phosphonate transport system substrate-binding protein